MRYITNIRMKKLVKPVKHEEAPQIRWGNEEQVSAKPLETSGITQAQKVEVANTSNNNDTDNTVTHSTVEFNNLDNMQTD